jgi:RsiW-degrading membrane proteinase PrsW (M82 family)
LFFLEEREGGTDASASFVFFSELLLCRTTKFPRQLPRATQLHVIEANPAPASAPTSIAADIVTAVAAAAALLCYFKASQQTFSNTLATVVLAVVLTMTASSPARLI